MSEKGENRIIYFFSDVDGTLTDSCTYYSSDGEFMKKFSHIDGTGFFLLKQAGIISGIITGEESEIVKRRAEKLDLKYCFIGIKNKLSFMIEFAHQNNISLKQIAYIGDDLNDLELLKEVGYSFAPKNASKIVKDNVDYCCESVGGAGAFRESVEKLLSILGIDTIECFNRNSQ